MMKLLHACAAVITVVLFLVRRHCVLGRVCFTKSARLLPSLCSFEERSQTSVALNECTHCPRGAPDVCRRPKYKRDPEILIDNENIGVLPRG